MDECELHLLKVAKIGLYNMLLRKSYESMSKNEVDIAYLLSGDPDVQAVLYESMKKRHNHEE